MWISVSAEHESTRNAHLNAWARTKIVTNFNYISWISGWIIWLFRFFFFLFVGSKSVFACSVLVMPSHTFPYRSNRFLWIILLIGVLEFRFEQKLSVSVCVVFWEWLHLHRIALMRLHWNYAMRFRRCNSRFGRTSLMCMQTEHILFID